VTTAIGLPADPMSGTLSAAEVASAFGGATITTTAAARGVFTSHVTFPAGPEPRGAIGAHRARWEFTYESAGRQRTTAYVVDCAPMMVRPLLSLRDARTGRPAPFAEIMVGDRVWRSSGTGFIDPEVPLGVHVYAVRAPRYAASSGTLLLDRNGREITVTRRAPEVEPGGFTTPCLPPASCSARISVYDPSGSAALPERITLDAAPLRAELTSTSSEVVDAFRRRYTFPPAVLGGVVAFATVPFSVTNAAGARTRYVCEPPPVEGGWSCRELDPM
jgi:hypothetical protein